MEPIQTEAGGIPADPWQAFAGARWQDRIDVRDFIQANVTPYIGDAAFLAGPTERTRGLWSRLTAMFPDERARGIYDADTHTPASITSHAPGYIDREHELQARSDQPAHAGTGGDRQGPMGQAVVMGSCSSVTHLSSSSGHSRYSSRG